MTKLALRILLLAALSLTLSPHASAAAPARLRVAVVLDASGSMKDNDPDLLARLSARLLVDLADARDRVSISSFGSGAKKLAGAAGSAHDSLQHSLDGVVANEKCTDYARGLAAAADEFSGPVTAGERRLVVFLTDGDYQPPNEKGTGCDHYEKLKDADRSRLESGVQDATKRLAAAHAKVFVVGLGNAFDKAPRSRTLLEGVAQRTGGRFLRATTADRVPEFFTDVFAALVGSPVFKPAPAPRVRIDVPADAQALEVVARIDDPGASIELFRGNAKLAAPVVVRVEQGRKKRGYAVALLKQPEAGAIEVRPTKPGSLAVWAIADVGTSLGFRQVPAVLPETAPLRGEVALLSRQGKPVARDPGYLSKVTFHVELGGQDKAIPAAGHDGVAFDFGKLAPRDAPYEITARADHAEGFLEVEPAKLAVRVIHQIPLAVELDPVRFDTMAEPGVIAKTTVRVVAPARLPADLTLDIELPEQARRDLRVEPSSISLGPEKREQTLELTFADPKSLRSTSWRYDGEIAVSVAERHRQLVSGNKRFAAPLDGTLRPWTLGRWLREYRTEIAIGLALLLLIVWLVGRALAAKLPPKARIHYQEIGEPFESDSLIKRHAKRGAYRSARFRFPLGKKAKPLVWFVASGSGFEVRPAGTPVTEVGSSPETEHRTPFRGTWEQHYRLGDRYEVWLTRS